MSALQCLCQILNATSLRSKILGFMITHAPVVFPLRLLIPAGQFWANHRVRTKKIPCNNTHFKLIWKSLYVTREPLHEYWRLYACVLCGGIDELLYGFVQLHFNVHMSLAFWCSFNVSSAPLFKHTPGVCAYVASFCILCVCLIFGTKHCSACCSSCHCCNCCCFCCCVHFLLCHTFGVLSPRFALKR